MREGMIAKVLVDGEEAAAGLQHIFADGEAIEVRFEQVAE